MVGVRGGWLVGMRGGRWQALARVRRADSLPPAEAGTLLNVDVTLEGEALCAASVPWGWPMVFLIPSISTCIRLGRGGLLR